jgi:hypothetical protein
MGLKKRRHNADFKAVEKRVNIFFTKRVVKITFLTPTVDFVRKIFRGQVILARLQTIKPNMHIAISKFFGSKLFALSKRLKSCYPTKSHAIS